MLNQPPVTCTWFCCSFVVFCGIVNVNIMLDSHYCNSIAKFCIICEDTVLWITPLQYPRWVIWSPYYLNLSGPTHFWDHVIYCLWNCVAKRVCWKAVIVQTSNGFCTCMQKRYHGELICHSCGSDFILPPLRKYILPDVERKPYSSNKHVGVVNIIGKRCSDVTNSCSNFGIYHSKYHKFSFFNSGPSP